MEEVPPTLDQLESALAEHDPVKLYYNGHPQRDVVEGAEEILRTHRTRLDVIADKVGDLAWKAVTNLRFANYMFPTNTYSDPTPTDEDKDIQ